MKKKLAAACAAMLCGVVTSCSIVSMGAALDGESAKAQLDHATGHITLPLDEYIFPNDYDITLINNFINTARSECMRKRGYDFKLPQFKREYLGSEEDQRYGFWNVELAKKYGSATPAVGSAGYAGNSRQFSQAFQDLNKAYHNTFEGKPLNAYQKIIMDCAVKADVFAHNLVPEIKDTQESRLSVARRLAADAAVRVRRTRGWDEAKEKYGSCLGENQLTLSNDGVFGSQELVELTAVMEGGAAAKTVRQLLSPSEQAKEDIRLVTIEAECNQKLGITQSLADIEASYQQDLIDKNKQELEQEKMRRQRVLRTMIDYIQEVR